MLDVPGCCKPSNVASVTGSRKREGLYGACQRQLCAVVHVPLRLLRGWLRVVVSRALPLPRSFACFSSPPRAVVSIRNAVAFVAVLAEPELLELGLHHRHVVPRTFRRQVAPATVHGGQLVSPHAGVDGLRPTANIAIALRRERVAVAVADEFERTVIVGIFIEGGRLLWGFLEVGVVLSQRPEGDIGVVVAVEGFGLILRCGDRRLRKLGDGHSIVISSVSCTIP